AVAIAVGAGVEGGEEVLEAEEVEEREIARAVAIGVAGWRGRQRAAPAGDVLRGHAAGAVEQPADVQPARVRAGAVFVEYRKGVHRGGRVEAGDAATNVMPVLAIPARELVADRAIRQPRKEPADIKIVPGRPGAVRVPDSHRIHR